MCGRYYIAEEDSAAELQEIIEQLNRRGAEVKTGEIYPTDTVPVLANNKSMVITSFAMKWCVHHRNCAAKPAKLSMDSAEIEQRFRVN